MQCRAYKLDTWYYLLIRPSRVVIYLCASTALKCVILMSIYVFMVFQISPEGFVAYVDHVTYNNAPDLRQ